jgi:hypothetical protein
MDEGKHSLELWWGPEKRPTIDYLSINRADNDRVLY